MSLIPHQFSHKLSSSRTDDMNALVPPTHVRNTYGDSNSAPEPEEEVIQKLKAVFEHQARSTTTGRRDTIDSILSKYETVRNEVQQDPRIGLALREEFDDPSLQNPTSYARCVTVESALREELDILSEGHESQCDGETQPTKDMTTYQAADDRTKHHIDIPRIDIDDRGGPAVNEAVPANGGFHEYDKDDSEITWDEETLLDIYTRLDEDLSQPQVETIPLVHAVKVADAKPTAESDSIDQDRFLATNHLSVSSIVQVAVLEPFVPVSSGEASTDTPTLLSNVRHDGDSSREAASALFPIFNPGIVAQISGDRTPATEGIVDACPIPELLHNLRNLQQRMDALVAEHATPRPSYGKSLNAGTKAELETPDEDLDWSTIGSGAATAEPENPEDKLSPRHVNEKLEQEPKCSKVKHPHELSGNSSFFESIEEDQASEYVLGAGLGIMFSSVVLAGGVFW